MSNETATQVLTIDATDSASLTEAIKAGITTPELLSEWIDGAELIEDALVLNPGTYYADDGNAECEYEADSGEEAAQAYVDGGDWGDKDKTHYIDVRTWRKGLDADGDEIDVDEENHTITINPDEPDCMDGEEHDWQSPHEIVGGCKENPGVWGNGGGVIITECCMRCGCQRKTDTWAQNPNNGMQGLREVSYEECKYANQVRKGKIRINYLDEDGGVITSHLTDDDYDDENVSKWNDDLNDGAQDFSDCGAPEEGWDQFELIEEKE